MPFGNMNFWLGSIGVMEFLKICTFHSHTHCIPETNRLLDDIEKLLIVDADIHQAIKMTLLWLANISSWDITRVACTRFYAFLDKTIQEFVSLDDGAEAHAKRLADWIIEKMDVNEKSWSDSGRFNQRQKSHFKAWNNVKRSKDRIGKYMSIKGLY